MTRDLGSRRGWGLGYLAVGVLLAGVTAPLGAAVINLSDTADAFVSASSPGQNYGGAGGLAVNGPSASSGSGQLDTVLKFPAPTGVAGQVITAATLKLTEDGAPNLSLFSVHAGTFQVRLSAQTGWDEGTGRPNNGTTASGSQISYSLLQSLIVGNPEFSLGTFTNAGTGGLESFNLTLDSHLNSIMLSGNPFTLHLTPVSSTVGFTFFSKDKGLAPTLTLTTAPVPEPAAGALLLLGAAPLLRRGPARR